jgi:hypothetical protein
MALLQTTSPEDSRREDFALAYRAELDSLPLRAWYRALLQLAEWLQIYPSVTLLSYELVPPLLECQTMTQRTVLRTWLLRVAGLQSSRREECVL